jgi:conjugal transfer pilus assembly protein TraV
MNATHLGGRRWTALAAKSSLYGLALATVIASTGCATLGGNVSGDFACRAPGGSCSPMSAIDARAVQTMLGAADAASDRKPSTNARPLHSQLASGATGRTGERTLRIVFPAHVDRAGVLHDEATAHVVVEDAAWTVSPPTSADRPPSGALDAAPDLEISRSPAPSSLREAVAGASAPAIEGLESLPAQAPHPIVGTTPGPTLDALAAARAGRRIARPGLIDHGKVAPDRLHRPPGVEAAPHGQTQSTGNLPAEAARVTAVGRLRALAKPEIEKLGQTTGEADLDGVVAPATKTEGAPR